MKPFAIVFVIAAASASAIPAQPVFSQYHAQDELGQYNYGYAGGPSSKTETRSIDGVTKGAFSYIDSNGLVQSRSYISDPFNGFRVAASDVPVGHPEAVSVALPAVSTYTAAAPVVSSYSAASPVVSSYSAASPVVSTYTAAAPVVATRTVAVAPVVSTYSATSSVIDDGVHSQYHAQDELGQYRYGYSGGSSAKDELKTADGVTRGVFSYIDGHGLVQTRSYVADDINGFRVAASDLPVGPAPATNFVAVAPVRVPIAAPVAPVASFATPVATPIASPVASPAVEIPVAPVQPVATVDTSFDAATTPSAESSPISAPAPSSPVESPAADDSVVVDSV